MSSLRKGSGAIIAASLASLFVVACSPNDTATELRQLQTDMERLQNEIGRLEFRIYELENPAPAPEDSSAAPTNGVRGAADAGLAEPLPDERFDLRPPD